MGFLGSIHFLMKNFFKVACVASAFLAPLTAMSQSQDSSSEQADELDFQAYIKNYESAQFDGTGKLGTHATVEVTDGLVFLNGSDANRLMKDFGNLPSKMEGLLIDTSGSWFITFTFDPVGYVKDDEKDDLDADKILSTMKDNQKEANKQRQQAGLYQLNITGWQTPPRFNDTTKNLEWGVLLKDDAGDMTLNHEIRILGRKGVMMATLVCAPGDFSALEPKLASALDGFEYTSGNKYAEYKEGDKIAEYGLTGLIAGGAAFAIWKLWKPIVIGLAVVGAAAKNFISKLFGRG